MPTPFASGRHRKFQADTQKGAGWLKPGAEARHTGLSPAGGNVRERKNGNWFEGHREDGRHYELPAVRTGTPPRLRGRRRHVGACPNEAPPCRMSRPNQDRAKNLVSTSSIGPLVPRGIPGRKSHPVLWYPTPVLSVMCLSCENLGVLNEVQIACHSCPGLGN
jgi:hypothetical protein